MTHVFSLAHLLGIGGADELVDHGVEGLTGKLRDSHHGGWFTSVDANRPADGDKGGYEHAFVLLAAASAEAAGHPQAGPLLNDALSVHDRWFWDDEYGMVVDRWDRSFARLDPYRGINANMHTVEAYLAVGDVTGERLWHQRALRIAHRMIDAARTNDWRIPEHYDQSWRPRLDHNRDRPDDRFRPYGATVGHGLEWARLLLHLHASTPEQGGELVKAAVGLFDRAVGDGWHVDGAPGFVYTTDWDGAPIVTSRLHWVLTEAINAAAALQLATGDRRYARWYDTWWEYAETYLIDRKSGSWHHELDATNHPAAQIWEGKPDVYHALQAALIPQLPLAPSLAVSLARGRH